MLFAIHARDKSGALALRTASRDAHIAFLKAAGSRLKLAGPLLDEAGAMCGSLLIYEAETLTDVHAWLGDDPYGKAGLFETVIVSGVNPVLGELVNAS